MAAAARSPALAFLISLLVLSPPSSSPCAALRLSQWPTLLSLSRSLMSRVANAREARGDRVGAESARNIANKLRFVGGGAPTIISATWDFAYNYAWRGGIDFRTAFEVSRAAAELLVTLGEAVRLESATDRAAWAIRNRSRLLARANALIRSLLRAFAQSGPLREAVLVIKREVVEGELLKDCLEVGAGDLQGLIRIARDLFSSEIDRNDEL